MNLKQSRVPVQLRQNLVAEVRSSLRPGMEFNALYGQVLARLEKAEQPSLELARTWLQKPETLLAERAEKQASTHEAQDRLRELVVNANVPKADPIRKQVISDTLAFLNQFPQLTPAEIKAVTLLRQENGHRNPRVIYLHEVATPEHLADDLADAQSLAGSAGQPGARYSATCQIFLLKEGELLRHERPDYSPVLVEMGGMA